MLYRTHRERDFTARAAISVLLKYYLRIVAVF